MAALRAAAPQVRFSRAAAGDKETPLIPCPLLPDAADASGRPVQETYPLWDVPTAIWMRARWVRDGWHAMAGLGLAGSAPATLPAAPLSLDWSVTVLQDLASCPFLFFAGTGSGSIRCACRTPALIRASAAKYCTTS